MKQFIKFGIVGVSNTLISYGLYALTLFIFDWLNASFPFEYLVAQFVSFTLSVLWSFYWNNRFVFGLREGEKRSIAMALLKTYIAYSVTGMFLSSILLVFWVQVLGISEFLAPIISLIITVPANYLLNKYWAFARDSQPNA